MNTYRVRIALRAGRALADIERKDQQRIRAAIDLLADNPRPPSCVAVRGERSVYRVRVGDYRIVYQVLDGEHVIYVIRVGHRREIYRQKELHRTGTAALKSNGASLDTALKGKVIKVSVQENPPQITLGDYNKLPDPRVILSQVDINKGNKQIAHGINRVLLPVAKL